MFRVERPPGPELTLLLGFRPYAFLIFPPGVTLLAWPVTREITPAGSASIRSRAATQQNSSPERRMIILLAPGSKFLAVAARTTGVLPRPRVPHARTPTGLAAPATQRIRSEQCLDMLGKALPVRHAYISRATFGTGKLHRYSPDYNEFGRRGISFFT